MLHGCLGRRKSPPDHRTLKLSAYLDYKQLPPPPPARPWSHIGGELEGAIIPISLFGNDQLGDCTCAAIAHHDQIAAAQVGETSSITRDAVIELYKGSGYTPTDPSTDQGWSNLEAARAARKAGWIDGFASFEVGSRGLVEIVVNAFGSAYCGIDLPLSAQKQMGKVWDVAPAGQRDSSYDRGSWGGHAVSVVDTDHEGVTIATWGAYQRATWSFLFTYFDEGIALLNKRWRKNKRTPAGIQVDELIADITRLAAA